MVVDLAGQRVLITGGSSGIGAAVARLLGCHGMHVAIHYNTGADAANTIAGEIRASGGEAVTLGADMRRSAEAATAVDEAAAALGGLDLLINNAGSLVGRIPVADITDEMLDDLIDTNIRGVVACTRAAIPHLRKSANGAIINTSSVAARNGGGPGSVIYASTKGFVSTMTRGLAKELAPDGIRVNAVAPGVIQTPLHDRFTSPEQLGVIAASIPMGRLGTAEECAGAFLWLASPALSSYVTGQIIEVNGGQVMP
ncbi:SDR family oxidoreductase [Fodinicurvata sp. EGI_FJ10296]|uniref:SDR family NAD(P)-dependent oxidoreductase n=1 Tax=Fodinicurvata sp. EGI_FJ10296 TaxID=3231908 RepID=UPI0034554726